MSNNLLPDSYQWHNYLLLQPGDNTTSHDMITDDDGNAYVAGLVSRSTTRTRFLQKYRHDGSPVPPVGTGSLWFQVDQPYAGDIPRQVLALDARNKHLYVLFIAQELDSAPPSYVVALACHDSTTGQKISTWNSGASVFVGETCESGCDITIDSEGAVWTAHTEYFTTRNGRLKGIRVKKWSGQDGAPIPLPQDGAVSSDSAEKVLIGLCARRSDNAIYLAYREASVDGLHPLVATLWRDDFTFIMRKVPDCVFFAPPDAHEETLSVALHTTITDDEDYLVVAGVGTYSYEGAGGDPGSDTITRYALRPVILRLDGDLNIVYRYADETLSCSISSEWVDNAEGRVASGAAGCIIYHMTEGFTTVLMLDANGTVVDRGFYVDWGSELPGDVIEYPEGSGQMHPFFFHQAASAYVRTPARLLTTGRCDLVNIAADGALTSSYGNVVEPGHFEHYPPEIPWSFETIAKIAIWVKENWDRIFPPFPGPKPREPWQVPGVAPSHGPYAPWQYYNRRGQGPAQANRRFAGDVFAMALGILAAWPRLEFPDRAIAGLADAFERVAIGPRFDATSRRDLVQTLRALAEGRGSILSAARQVLFMLSAMELDWRGTAPGSKVVGEGKQRTVALGALGRVLFDDVADRGRVRLSISEGIPAVPKGFEPAWPLSVYNVEFDGRYRGKLHVDLALWPFLLHGARAPRLLVWNGKVFSDVTTYWRSRARVISGEITGRATFLVAVPTGEMSVSHKRTATRRKGGRAASRR